MIVRRCACIVVRLNGTQFIKVKFAGDVVAIDNLDKICLVPRGFVDALLIYDLDVIGDRELIDSVVFLFYAIVIYCKDRPICKYKHYCSPLT